MRQKPFIDPIQHEIAKEQAEGLVRTERRFVEALEAYRLHGEAASAEASESNEWALWDLVDALTGYVVQREACGLRDAGELYRLHQVPRAAIARIGVRRPPHTGSRPSPTRVGSSSEEKGSAMAIELQGVCPLLQVFDMQTALRFYCDVLGFSLMDAVPPGPGVVHWARLRHGDAELMLNTLYDDGERPPAPNGDRVACHADVILYFACPDVDGAYARLCARGIAVEPPAVANYGMKQLYLKDPDGYGLCLQWPAR